MISEKLISEVLSVELSALNCFNGIAMLNIDDNIIYIHYYETDLKCMCGLYTINIYELANKCKEWAFEKGWILESCRASNYTDSDGQFESKRFMTSCTSLTSKRGKTFESITSEVESIIIACEWIYDYKIKNQK